MITQVNKLAHAVTEKWYALKQERDRLKTTLDEIDAEILRMEGEVRALTNIAQQYLNDVAAQEQKET